MRVAIPMRHNHAIAPTALLSVVSVLMIRISPVCAGSKAVSQLANRDGRSFVTHAWILCAGPASTAPRADRSMLQNGCPAEIIGVYYVGALSQPSLPPESLDTSLFTHAFYAFAAISPTNFSVIPFNALEDPNVMSRLNAAVRMGSACGKTLISVGGAEFSQAAATKHVWSAMASSVFSRTQFITSVISFARWYAFDGIDLVGLAIALY